MHPKVKRAGVAGAVVTIAIAVLGALGVEVPTGAADAAVTVLSVLAAYLKPAT